MLRRSFSGVLPLEFLEAEPSESSQCPLLSFDPQHVCAKDLFSPFSMRTANVAVQRRFPLPIPTYLFSPFFFPAKVQAVPGFWYEGTVIFIFSNRFRGYSPLRSGFFYPSPETGLAARPFPRIAVSSFLAPACA